ncbi:Hypothetical predicted protein [Paramuricea clavata]|uniref:Uncharacterized protein n=1 Tax=Paramuricea clavata TaxID=317549 RepID=A0A7D9I4N1_PARCT|nr:Hypothetical predicted protein [Paramuricea clavata]
MEENVVENNVNDRDTVERSSFLVILGWITLFILYWGQVGLLVSILAIPHDFLFFVPAFVFTCIFLRQHWAAKHADEDRSIWYVWAIWGTYIVAYVVVVAVIFGTVAKDLTEEDALVAALNIFDGIQMLEIYLMQNERHFDFDSATEDLKDFLTQNGGDQTERLKDFLMRSERPFDLNSETEVCIIVFACICFLLSSFGLVRNKFGANGEVKERETTSAVFGLLEIFGTNFPFLVLRIVIWKNH